MYVLCSGSDMSPQRGFPRDVHVPRSGCGGRDHRQEDVGKAVNSTGFFSVPYGLTPLQMPRLLVTSALRGRCYDAHFTDEKAQAQPGSGKHWDPRPRDPAERGVSRRSVTLGPLVESHSLSSRLCSPNC